MEKFEKKLKIETERDKAAEEMEVDKEEKAKSIQNYVRRELSRLKEGTHGYAERVKEFFSELHPLDFEKILGEENFALVSEIIFRREDLKKQIAEETKKAGLLREFASFMKENPEMLPLRFCKTMEAISNTGQLLDRFFHYSFSNLEKEITSEKWPKIWTEWAEKQLMETERELKENGIVLLKERKEEWEKYSSYEYEREKEEKPMKIEGFEKFDLPQIKAEKILEAALGLLPRGILAENVKVIRYTNEDAPDIEEDYGIEGKAAAYYDGLGEEVGFYKIEDEENFFKKLSSFEELSPMIIHEFFHSLDPRLHDQKGIPPVEQLRIIKDWEKIREEEPVAVTSFVKSIKNKNKEKEIYLKSIEDWAESGTIFLHNPSKLYDKSPKRYWFINDLLKRYFPGFDTEQQFKKLEKYMFFIILPKEI